MEIHKWLVKRYASGLRLKLSGNANVTSWTLEKIKLTSGMLRKLEREFGLYSKFIITSAALKWQQIGTQNNQSNE